MATLNTVWNTQELFTGFIAPLLVDNVALIPGVTINAGVQQISASGAVYYVQGEAAITSGAAGRDYSDNAAGNTRVVVPLTQSLQIAEKMPFVVEATTPIGFVGQHASNSTVKLNNQWGKLGLAALVNGGTHKKKAATTGATIYADIVDNIKEYDIANSDKAAATAIIVGPTTLAKLRQAPEFALNPAANTGLVHNGIVGSVAGLPVVQARNFDSIAASDLADFSTMTGLEYVILNADAFLAPKIYDMIDVIPKSEVFPGSKLVAEVPYGFKVAVPTQVFVRLVTSAA